MYDIYKHILCIKPKQPSPQKDNKIPNFSPNKLSSQVFQIVPFEPIHLRTVTVSRYTQNAIQPVNTSI